jgi:hypothetical protein
LALVVPVVQRVVVVVLAVPVRVELLLLVQLVEAVVLVG